MARVLAERLAARLGQGVHVEPLTGAGGAIGMRELARAEPDGCTLGMPGLSTMVIAPLVDGGDRLGYDPATDFTPVAMVGGSPAALAVRAGLGISILAALADVIRNEGRALTYATPGPATITAILPATVLDRISGQAIVVPYAEAGAAVIAAVEGHVDAVSLSVFSLRAQVVAGALVPLYVSSRDRLAAWPDVPTLAELGHPDLGTLIWFGLSAPAGMDAALAAELNAAANEVLSNPEAIAALAAAGGHDRADQPRGTGRHGRRPDARVRPVHRRQGTAMTLVEPCRLRAAAVAAVEAALPVDPTLAPALAAFAAGQGDCRLDVFGMDSLAWPIVVGLALAGSGLSVLAEPGGPDPAPRARADAFRAAGAVVVMAVLYRPAGFPVAALAATALAPATLIACLGGVTLGTLVGVSPGLGPLAAMSVLLPLTYGMDPGPALMMMGGIWYGAAYGGAITAILINIPGTAMASVTAIDGHPMARAGRPGPALLLAALGSFAGGAIGILATMIAVPLLSRHIPVPDPAALIIVCLIAGAGVGNQGAARGAAMVCLGALAGLVGTDPMTGEARLTFGLWPLEDGISLSALVIDVFGLSEIIRRAGAVAVTVPCGAAGPKGLCLDAVERRAPWRGSLRGGVIGAALGLLPGVGPTVASYAAHAAERRRGTPGLGRGAVEGIVAPEAADNASDQTAFIPTLVPGIPGSGAMAIILVVLMIHGIDPGPDFLAQNGALCWGLLASFWIGNVLLLVLNIPMVGVRATLLRAPPATLYPVTIVIMCAGLIATGQVSDLFVLAFAGLLGAGLQGAGFPMPLLLLGFILGPLLEADLVRAALIARGDPVRLVANPGAVGLLSGGIVLTVVLRRTGRRLSVGG